MVSAVGIVALVALVFEIVLPVFPAASAFYTSPRIVRAQPRFSRRSSDTYYTYGSYYATGTVNDLGDNNVNAGQPNLAEGVALAGDRAAWAKAASSETQHATSTSTQSLSGTTTSSQIASSTTSMPSAASAANTEKTGHHSHHHKQKHAAANKIMHHKQNASTASSSAHPSTNTTANTSTVA